MTHLPKLLNRLFMEQVLASQFPSADDMGTAIESVATAATERLDLPHSYTIVPAVALNQSNTEVVQRSCVETFCGNFEKASFDEYKPLTWASYHVHL